MMLNKGMAIRSAGSGWRKFKGREDRLEEVEGRERAESGGLAANKSMRKCENCKLVFFNPSSRNEYFCSDDCCISFAYMEFPESVSDLISVDLSKASKMMMLKRTSSDSLPGLVMEKSKKCHRPFLPEVDDHENPEFDHDDGPLFF